MARRFMVCAYRLPPRGSVEMSVKPYHLIVTGRAYVVLVGHCCDC